MSKRAGVADPDVEHDVRSEPSAILELWLARNRTQYA
jgi:hypothetical protein